MPASLNSEKSVRLSSQLGYVFRDVNLLYQAMTHGSSGKKANYERLEFLGDRVLGLVIAEELYRQHGRDSEGKLSTRHSSMVRGEVCADVAEGLGISEFLHVGTLERKQGLHQTRSMLGDVMEALIGAVYIDGGMDAAKAFVLKHWAGVLKKPRSTQKDAKTYVQEWALARAKSLPVYEVVARSGPEHKPEFTVRLSVADHDPCEGQGPTKQAAEMAAAEKFIEAGALR